MEKPPTPVGGTGKTSKPLMLTRRQGFFFNDRSTALKGHPLWFHRVERDAVRCPSSCPFGSSMNVCPSPSRHPGTPAAVLASPVAVEYPTSRWSSAPPRYRQCILDQADGGGGECGVGRLSTRTGSRPINTDGVCYQNGLDPCRCRRRAVTAMGRNGA